MEAIDDNERESFKKIKAKLSTSGYLSYYPCPKSGSMLYDSSILSEGCLKLVYTLMSRTQNVSRPSLDIEYVRAMIKRQIALSKRSIDFDCRQLFGNVEGTDSKLEQYFDAELLKFVDDVTLSETSIQSENTTIQHTTSRKLKCMMICAIMANNMDPRDTFMQTLIGLACHAPRDKGMKILNAFVVTCSTFHIRQHGAKIRGNKSPCILATHV